MDSRSASKRLTISPSCQMIIGPGRYHPGSHVSRLLLLPVNVPPLGSIYMLRIWLMLFSSTGYDKNSSMSLMIDKLEIQPWKLGDPKCTALMKMSLCLSHFGYKPNGLTICKISDVLPRVRRVDCYHHHVCGYSIRLV